MMTSASGSAAKTVKRARRLGSAQLVLGASSLVILGARALPPYAYGKDLQQQFLMGMALRDRLDIYTPITQLSARYFPAATNNFPHPSPYPPLVALLSVPLTFVGMPVLVLLWLAASVLLLVAVGRRLGLSTRASLALAAWPPVWWVLYIGQLELAILLLAVLAWQDAKAGKEWRAGAWLGIAAAVKFYPVIFLAPYLYRRRWRVVVATGAILLLGQLGNLIVVGPAGLVRYYRESCRRSGPSI